MELQNNKLKIILNDENETTDFVLTPNVFIKLTFLTNSKTYVKMNNGLFMEILNLRKRQEFSKRKYCKYAVINSLAHQPFEKLGEVPCETSIKKCVTVDVSHIIFWR